MKRKAVSKKMRLKVYEKYHATAQYFEYEGSKPVVFEEAQRNIKNNVHGWNVF